MIQIRNQIRGRTRLRVSALYRNAPTGRRLEKRLSDAEGIYRVRINTLCASLVVYYNANKLSPDLLNRNIAALLGERFVGAPLTGNSNPFLAGMVSTLVPGFFVWGDGAATED